MKKDLKRTDLKLVIYSFFLFCFFTIIPLLASEQTEFSANSKPAPIDNPAPVSVMKIQPFAPVFSHEELGSSIRSVLEQPEFAWRLPREVETKEAAPFFDSFLKWFKSILKPMRNWLKPYWIELKKFLEDWFDGQKNSHNEKEVDGQKWVLIARRILYVFVGVSLLGLAYAIYRFRQRLKSPQIEIQPLAVKIIPDLEDESISAGAMPADEWMSLASSLCAEGKFRLASRAIYLSSLALLERHNMIRTAKSKSNGDYFRETSRRAFAQPQVINLLGSNIQIFERGWYGTHNRDI